MLPVFKDGFHIGYVHQHDIPRHFSLAHDDVIRVALRRRLTPQDLEEASVEAAMQQELPALTLRIKKLGRQVSRSYPPERVTVAELTKAPDDFDPIADLMWPFGTDFPKWALEHMAQDHTDYVQEQRAKRR